MTARRVFLGGLAASALGCGRGHAMTCEEIAPDWRFVADRVMGGVSVGQITPLQHAGQPAMRLTGTVSLDNNGGFIQMALNPAKFGRVLDASGFRGVSFMTQGNDTEYEVSLRTTDLTRPWQSYRAAFRAGKSWTRIDLDFDAFVPNRTKVALNPARLRRIGILAIGREFEADVAVSGLCLRR